MCDIEACFHRILVDPQDIDALRFFFWKDFDLNQPYVVFRMLVHLFGSTSSPSISTFAIRYLAELFKNEYPPEVILAILWNLYVDDLIKSCPDVQSAIKLINGLVNLLKRGGFRLTKFVSNSREVLAAIPSEDRAKSVKDFDESTLPVERALGVKLDVEDDAFVFKVSHLKVGEIRNTRRLILGLISSVWDPIGFLACVLLKGRRILQVLTCDKRYGWDEVISDEELEEFQEWALSLLLLETMKVPRWIGSPALGKITSTQLHFCSDASDTAYGACAYIRKADEAGNIHAALVAAKSRVTPLKHQCEFDINGSMPKMEFCAGVVAVQLFIFLISELGLEFDEVWFWCDSTCVIRWVRNRTTRHKPFVFNRISQILAATKMEQWRYCPTDLNPADLCSRGFKSDDQESWNFFLTGGFLQRPSSEWPENPLDAAPAEDVVANLAATSIAPSFNFIGKLSERVSSWAKLVKHLIWWKRFKSYLMEKFLPNRKCKATVGPISVAEMKTAEADIFVFLQEDRFSEELSYLNEIEADEPFRVIGKQKSLNSKDSQLRRLDPFIHENLIRVGGRLGNSSLQFSAKYPIILPSNSHAVSLLVRQEHAKQGHAGVEQVHHALRQSFWILKGRQTIKKEIGKCRKCRRLSAKPCTQKMASLPSFRVTPGTPFQYVGVDYLGPFLIRWGRSTRKRWICLFTDMKMRGVHLEVAADLTPTAFINCFFRFISRRPGVEFMFLDCGTNFTAAESQLKDEIKKWNADIDFHMRLKGIKWSFNPPAAPHWGGIWERLVRSTKRILTSICNSTSTPTDDVLNTLVTAAEGIINQRPLTRVSDDSRDLNALSPAQLTSHGTPSYSSASILPPCVDADGAELRRHKRQAETLADTFWLRWSREYLSTLQERQKWLNPSPDLNDGDLVLLVDEKRHCADYPLARITHVFPGSDGLVRRVRVRTSRREYDRDRSRIVLLEASDGGGSDSTNDNSNNFPPVLPSSSQDSGVE